MASVDSYEQKRRRRERVIALAVFVVLIAFTAIEVHLLRLSSKLPFVNSIFFFGLMNLNIVLIMLLLFLVFRNAVKMILDERRGKLGSKLRTQLVFCFTLFAIVPTVFLFTISAFYIKNSFDKWFNLKVGGTLQKSIEVVRNYYENSEKNATHFARKIATNLERSGRTPYSKVMDQARVDYGLDAVEYYAGPFANRIISVAPDKLHVVPGASLETLRSAFSGKNECRVHNVGEGELVRCGILLGIGKGVIFANYFIPTSLASQLSEINLTYADYKTDNPLNYPIKSTYFAILSMVTLLILFTATWTGFYVAKRLTVPIEELSKGTDEVAHGNLDYQIPKAGSDEMSRLIQSFNLMIRDLNQNKKQIEVTHEELERRRRYIEILLESVQSGVISLDENGKISMINPTAAELLGLRATEFIGKPYWAAIPDQHRAEFRDLLMNVYGTTKPIRRELRITAPNGELITLLVTLSALRHESQKPLGIVGVFDNVTEIQKMERMMAWKEVARRMAHEIKNPLTPIRLSVERLRRRYLDKIQDDGTFGKATEMILKEVDSLKSLVGEFSTFARLPEIQKVPDDLNGIILEVVNLFRAAHEEIQFGLELEEGLPRMDLDRAQLKRALMNLFDNAVAAMDGKGSIEVKTEQDSEQKLVRLELSDHGCGIAESAYAQLFEPYFSTKEGGTGLGLAIVQRIVTDHGGRVRAMSNSPKGTKFIMEFPQSVDRSLAVTLEDERRPEESV